MARAPTMPAAGAAADPADPMASADAGDDAGADSGDDTGDMSNTVLVTIASAPDGGYVVYSGDEPDGGGGDAGGSADDDAAMGGGDGAGGGAAGAPMATGGAAGADAGASGGQHVDSIGAALKAALDILNESAGSAGAPGSADDQFASGFDGDKSPTPAAAKSGRGMKYPPGAMG
jgi:hypothetical protein